MRMATEGDVVTNGEREGRLLSLRHDGDPARQLAPIQSPRVVAVHRDLPGRNGDTPEQRTHERALAAPVRPRDGRDAPPRRLERDTIHGGASRAWVPDDYAVEPDH